MLNISFSFLPSTGRNFYVHTPCVSAALAACEIFPALIFLSFFFPRCVQSRTSSSSSPDKLPEITIRPGEKREKRDRDPQKYPAVPYVFFVALRDTAREGAPFFDIPPLFKSVPRHQEAVAHTLRIFPFLIQEGKDCILSQNVVVPNVLPFLPPPQRHDRKYRR